VPRVAQFPILPNADGALGQDFLDVGSPVATASFPISERRSGEMPWTKNRGISLTRKRMTLSLNLEQKQAVVAEVAKQVAGASAIVMVENRGMAVADMTRLRAKARASGVYFRVVKNTLVRRAVVDSPFASLAEKMVGPLAYGIGPDPVAVAKVLNEFAKGNEKFVITGGAMPGKVMTAKEIASLATLPSREELMSKLLGTMQAPVVKLVRTLNEVPSKFVRTLAAVRDAKQAA
jgi:large subunit ribosomal protein L10